jgi:hypothetical protein
MCNLAAYWGLFMIFFPIIWWTGWFLYALCNRMIEWNHSRRCSISNE